MKAHRIAKFTVQEYIQHEIESNSKHEYHNGEIFALAGGTLNHGLICGNVYLELRNKLRANNLKCFPFNSEVKLYVDKTNSYVYPDSMVTCGDIEHSKEDKNSVTNPILIIEVLSKSTAAYDRGDKFYLYRQIPTLKEYVMVEQKRYLVDVHYKHENSDLWKITRYEGLDKVVSFQSIGVKITMEELYYKTKIDLLL